MTARRKPPRVITALDVESRTEALALIQTLRGTADLFKVGSRLFTAEGPRMTREIAAAGGSVFLDLKFHDIPATVAGAVRAACGLRAFMMTLHTAGGTAMMRAAAEAAAECAARTGLPRPLLVGVTVLTSMSAADLEEISCYGGSVEDLVLRRAEKARESGLDGIVASVAETARIRSALGDGFVIVTPGIRPAGAGAQDQKRTATPAAAAEAGSDFLVVGRPIYAASDPAAAARAIMTEIGERAV